MVIRLIPNGQRARTSYSADEPHVAQPDHMRLRFFFPRQTAPAQPAPPAGALPVSEQETLFSLRRSRTEP